jgi:hypothetical protein
MSRIAKQSLFWSGAVAAAGAALHAAGAGPDRCRPGLGAIGVRREIGR